MDFDEFFSQVPKLALGFSGGVDSSYVLYEAKRHGADVKAYLVKTAFQPQFEVDRAVAFAQEQGVELEVITFDILHDPSIAPNPEDRCYHCKHRIFRTIQEHALADGYTVLADGSNASDDPATRPGMQALSELEVRSPLREAGITKAQVRERSRIAGLNSWDLPAYSCLATRVPPNMALTPELLARIEAAEGEMFALGFRNMRVRVIDETSARIQVTDDEFSRACELREQLASRLSAHFTHVYLDLRTRQAS